MAVRPMRKHLRTSVLVLCFCTALLALVPVAAVSAKPVPLNAQFLHWQEVSRIIHILVFSDDGRPGQPPACVGAGQPLVFGFEWGGPEWGNAAALQAWMDDPLSTMTVSVDGGPAIDIKGYYQPAFWSTTEMGPAWTWDHDGDGPGDGDGDGIGDWDGAVVFFRYPHPGVGHGIHTFTFDYTTPTDLLSGSDTITVEAR